MIERRKALTMAVVLVFLSSALSYYAGVAGLVPRLAGLIPLTSSVPGPGAAAAGGVDQEQIKRIQEYIEDKSLYQIPVDKLTEGALKGMVEATDDKYAAYYNQKEFQTFLDHFKASFSGIGVHVEISPKTGLVTVVAPIKGSPGDQAGVLAGDSIVAVDDKDIRGFKLDEAVQLIRGPKGTKVKISVQREGVADPLNFVITRQTIEIQSTDHRMIDKANGVGYLQIREFNEQVSARVSRALAELKAQGMTRLIVDLRQNPGGLLDEAINVSSFFVPAKEPVVHIEYRGGERETHNSKAKDRFTGPLVVLIDDHSASASEIVAGAIKDTKLGVLLGKKSFGKGTVQTFYNLPDGAGIKLTTARYLTAGGTSIQDTGIEPDIAVENPTPVRFGEPGDVQLDKAIEHIKTMKR